MEQEELMREYYRDVKVTGAFFMKALAISLKGGYERTKRAIEKHRNKPISGEQSLEDLLGKNKATDIRSFENSELNLIKLKEYLKKFKIDFSILKNEDETVDIVFKRKDTKLFEASVQKVLNDIVKNPKEVTEKIAKKESDLLPNQQIEKHDKERVEKRKEKAAKKDKKNKTKGKTIS